MRLSLRWKIVGGFGLLLTLIVLLGWVTLSLLTSLRDVQRKVFDDAIPGLITVDEIIRSYIAQSGAVSSYLINFEQSQLDQYEREVATSAVWEERAQRLFESEEERRLLDDLREAGASFQTLVDDRVIPLASRGERSQAFRVLGEEGTALTSEIEALGGILRDAQDRSMIETESALVDRQSNTTITLLLVTLAVLAVGIVMTYVLPKRLSANLGTLVEAARAIGRGDFDQQIVVHSSDEVGELATRFSEMQTGLKRLQQLALHDRELQIAAGIQRNLLQRALPEPPGMHVLPMQRQANLVGGDWYDVDLTGGILTVVVGDASGKGIAAALMSTVALSAIRGERSRGGSAQRAIEAANQALREATEPESFTTAVYTTINSETGEARWMNMGHHSPFILRSTIPEGSQARGYYLEGPRNRALGWFDDPGFNETVVRLEPGDRLFLFMDGFLEAKSPEGEVFGEHRLAEALVELAPLGSEAVLSELVSDVERFAAGKLDDDLTMLVIEWLGAPLGE